MRYVYIIQNLVNGKVYIGQTNNPRVRKNGHWYNGTHHANGHLYDSMRKHGIINFKFSLLEECEVEQVDEREMFWIAHYDSTNPTKGYNKESGGHKNKTLSEETKQKLSAANKGVPFTPERCENISKALSGKSNPKNRRENNPQRGRAISETLKGRPLSEEHKKAISETLSTYFATHEISHTEESKRNMSEAQKIVGAKKTEMATFDATHPDAHPKTCPVCNKQYSPKRLVRHWVIRHKTKRWCSRACALIAHNARDKTITVA